MYTGDERNCSDELMDVNLLKKKIQDSSGNGMELELDYLTLITALFPFAFIINLISVTIYNSCILVDVWVSLYCH